MIYIDEERKSRLAYVPDAPRFTGINQLGTFTFYQSGFCC
jgi:hypothetical protein